MSESKPPKQRRLIPLGELIALAALIVSGLGVWIAWESSKNSGPTQVVQERSPVPLALRGAIDERGRTLTITPADSSHALESVVLGETEDARIERHRWPAGDCGRQHARAKCPS